MLPEIISWVELSERQKVALFAFLMKQVESDEMSADEMLKQQNIWVSFGVELAPAA